jgi:hypothetical protein
MATGTTRRGCPINESPVLYVFNGQTGRYPCGVFTSQAQAEQTIARFRLSGLLCEYPLNQFAMRRFAMDETDWEGEAASVQDSKSIRCWRYANGDSV